MAYGGKKVLITGADGFIGSHLAEALAAAGADVTALAAYNSFDSHGWLDDLPAERRAGLTLVRGDIRDAGFMEDLAREQEVIFHLAALIAIPFSYVAPRTYVETNVNGTLNVLEAARRAGAARVVHTSTSEVYGTAQTTPITEDHPLQGQSPYAASKIGADMMAEAFARSFDLPVVTLRPFNTFGPRQSERAVIPTVIRQALDPACEAIRIGDTSPERDFNYVGDIVRAFLAAGSAKNLEHGRTYNAGSGEARSIGDMIGIVQRLTGCNKPVETEAERQRPKKSEVMLLLAGAERFTAATGWSSETGFETGLGETIDWWRDRIARGAVRADASYAT